MNTNCKNTIRFTTALFLITVTIIYLCFNVYAYADWPSDINAESEGAILMDADSGAVLYGKNIHEHYYPASITKILTALVVIENCDLDEMVTFSKDAVYNVEPGSSSAGIDVGDTLTVRDTLYAMLLQSANEAANALAEHTAGSIDNFTEMMNRKAASLGCTDSNFVNPSGLNNPEHYTSAYDFALISREAFKNPVLTEIDSAIYYNLPATIRIPTGQTLYTHHSMLRKNSGNYYQNVICGKTGYTTLAGNTLVTYARNENLSLITVILNGRQTHYTDTRALLDFGFNNFRNLSLNSALQVPAQYESNITLIPELNDYMLTFDEDSSILLPNSADTADISASVSFELGEYAPDNALAQVFYTYNGHDIGSTYLLALKSMSESTGDKTNANTVETVGDSSAASKSTDEADIAKATPSNGILSPKNFLLFGCIGILLILIVTVIIIIRRRIIPDNQNRQLAKELRIYNRLTNGWTPAECGISEDEAKDIIEKNS